ncbi:hypothetical protein TanjilG_25185 [Lupinus angustifolius]|uniref:PPM-type phosphatase domain-containing protein n=1 Tax=Lupinus angustifolius TaxID=3871 RepID=A0A1J7H538_LUPAN|nr:hypothetical protein TanjilG_25185 [Lupinus angustifolius]
MEENLHGGSFGVTALIGNGNLVVSNAGDCCAFIGRGGVAEALTFDHRPSREDERGRIETLVSDQEAVDLASPFCIGSNSKQSSLACKKLVESSISRGSVDDIKGWESSISITKLQHYI